MADEPSRPAAWGEAEERDESYEHDAHGPRAEGGRGKRSHDRAERHPEASASTRTRAKTRLLRVLDDQALSVRFVAAVAGDRPMTDGERDLFRLLRVRHRGAYYSDLIFALCHQYLPAGKAKALWEAIITHKERMRACLGRDPGVVVAALDYMTNVEPLVHDPIFVAEPDMNVVAEIAVKDGLTSLYDHHTFFTRLRGELARVRRYETPLSVLLFDVDHFKRYNDTHGHPAGDRALSGIGRAVLDEIRDVDTAARYGGEEFGLILPMADAPTARAIAERLRRRVAGLFDKPAPVTISVGCATAPANGRTAEVLLKAADQALYQAKRAGRDRVRAAGDRPPATP